MMVSAIFFLVTAVFLSVASLIMREGLAQKLGHAVSGSFMNRWTKREVPVRPGDEYEPAYCYNDCMRVHERTDPNFPCSVACNVRDDSHP
jgi:hypothetical protein